MNLWEYNRYKGYKSYVNLFEVQCEIQAKERELQEVIEKFKRRQTMTVSELITKLQAFISLFLYVVDKFAATAGEKHTLTQILNMLYGGINNEL